MSDCGSAKHVTIRVIKLILFNNIQFLLNLEFMYKKNCALAIFPIFGIIFAQFFILIAVP